MSNIVHTFVYRSLQVAILAVWLTAIASGASEAASAGSLEKITVLSSETSINHSVFYFGAEKDFYKRQGLDVTLDRLPADAAAILVSGQVQFITTGTGTESAAIKGAPVKMVLVTVGKPNFGVYGETGLTSVKELKGKSIWGDNDLLRAILQKHGLEPDKTVTIVQTRTTDPLVGIAAVKQGTVNAVFGWPPIGTMAKREGLREVFFAGDEIPEVPVSGIGTTDKLIKERPDMVKKFISGTLQTMTYMRNETNKEDIVSHYMRRWKFDREMAEESYKMMLRSLSGDGKVSEEARRQEVALVKRAAGITAEIPISQVWNFGLLDDVLRTK